MTGIGVGRSLKDLVTDRGAETYDYNLPYESGPKMSKNSASDRLEAEKEAALDDELQEYWNNKRNIESRNAIQAGKKRSVKERLGPIRASPEGTQCGNTRHFLLQKKRKFMKSICSRSLYLVKKLISRNFCSKNS